MKRCLVNELNIKSSDDFLITLDARAGLDDWRNSELSGLIRFTVTDVPFSLLVQRDKSWKIETSLSLSLSLSLVPAGSPARWWGCYGSYF